MQHWRQQRGMTFWGLAFFLGVLALFLFVGFKLFPPYMEDFKVRSALDSLARQPDFDSMTRPDIATALEKRFDIDNVTAVKLDTDLTVETQGRLKVVHVRYENVIPLVGNLSFLLEFDHVRRVGAGG